jgi:phosphoglycerate dehydrogenase-like enzyme
MSAATGLANPLRILLSDAARAAIGPRLAQRLGTAAHVLLSPAQAPVDFDIAFVSRDVTGLSTKHAVLPTTQYFYDLLTSAPSLAWVQMHSAGADRPVYVKLLAQGVTLSSSAGSNAGVVAQSALAGMLALARRLPQLMVAQRAHVWAPLIKTGLPRDLGGQTAVIVGWGGIGQQLGALLRLLGLRVVVVRSSATPAGEGIRTVSYEAIDSVLPQADWLLLACPLTDRTHGLISASALAWLPVGAHVVNVARGEVVDEAALIEALLSGRLAGAYLDVFAHEPLPAQSPLWDMPNVIASPHSAGFSDANAARVEEVFLDNLGRRLQGQTMRNLVG